MNKLPRTALALTASAAAAFAAYGLGTQSDGSATADDRTAAASSGAARTTPAFDRVDFRDGRGGDHGPAALATELGVTPAQLRKALREIRQADSTRSEKRAERIAAVAKALDLSPERVTAALEKVAPTTAGRRRGPNGGPRAFSSDPALARELGVSTAALTAAFDEAHEAQHAARSAERAGELAKLLEVDRAKVVAALEKLDEARPDGRGSHDGPGRHGGRGRAAAAAGLAAELGIAETKVSAAFETLRERREAEHEAQRKRFAEQLGSRLNLSVQKVTAALEDAPFGGPGHLRHR